MLLLLCKGIQICILYTLTCTLRSQWNLNSVSGIKCNSAHIEQKIVSNFIEMVWNKVNEKYKNLPKQVLQQQYTTIKNFYNQKTPFSPSRQFSYCSHVLCQLFTKCMHVFVYLLPYIQAPESLNYYITYI